MDGEWSRCPICFEDYSSLHRPTTFVCGHSTCIDHTIGLRRLRYCPICRHPLQEKEYHVSYSLEEASHLFQLIKNSIDWSTIKLSLASVSSSEDDSTLANIRRDEIYARQLQAEINNDIVREISSRQTQVSQTNRAPQIERTRINLATSAINQFNGYQKTCDHHCDLVTTAQCCACSDQRPHLANTTYEAYVDGQGIVRRARRYEYYCSTCKRRSHQLAIETL